MTTTPATLRIPGHPVVLKNSKQVMRVNGRIIVKSSKAVEAYQHKAIADGLVIEGGHYADPDPQCRTACELVGVANLLQSACRECTNNASALAGRSDHE